MANNAIAFAALLFDIRSGWSGWAMRVMALAAALTAFTTLSVGAVAQEFSLAIRDHKFEPAEIRVPAGKRVVISISNEDATPEEFDSPALKVEKVIPGRSKATVRIGPLTPGRYEFIGEFHSETAKGVVIAE
jgi:plastocyanin